MHLLSAAGGVAVLLLGILYQVSSKETVIGFYGETLEVPCKNGGARAENHLFFKWKYDQVDGPSDLMTKHKDQAPVVIAKNEYMDRVSMADNSSLLITKATLGDEKTFTCIEVTGNGLNEYPVKVLIHKGPTGIDIVEKADELEIGKLAKIAQCEAADANPAANITWYKNGVILSPDGKDVDIVSSKQVDPGTGLSTTLSSLRYSAQKGDADAVFSCRTMDLGGLELVSALNFTIIYPTEQVSLKVSPEGELLEGDKVTLQCVADGNPPPTTFNFIVKGRVENVVDSDRYTMTNITRDDTGEYRCSLAEKPSLEASANLTVSYLDVELSPSDEAVKKGRGEGLAVALKVQSSGDYRVSWTKDNVPHKTQKDLTFESLTYADAGLYEGHVTLGSLRRSVSLKLTVEGVPVIRQLTKSRGDSSRQEVLSCEAEGYPKPTVVWSINGSLLQEGPYVNGRITHQISVVPAANLTVFCNVSNELGHHTQGINVSSVFEEVRMDKQDQSGGGDQTKLVVGIVVGLLLATVIIGLAYWVYMKKAKQGSWKTGELENGSSEEEKKLEEKVEENSQKADM